MKKDIERHIEYFLASLRKTDIPLDQIKFILITEFNKRSLIYHFIANTWFESYFSLIQRLGYGKFDLASQILKLNESNDFICLMMAKYNIPNKTKPLDREISAKEIELLEDIMKNSTIGQNTGT